ncbi:hypothetical protein WR25_25298 [Diploscapter pachys]|uniref:Uncharacterized protein n=1 Tax=Diploscapter pachys TaxID=2018661 RepID=A0A2A2LHP3_9BILA|nr:hypothetical protein WR25_25298 [Diploscapter pachys]
MPVQNKPKFDFIAELGQDGVESLIVKVDTKLNLLVAEAAEATVINFLTPAGMLMNAQGGNQKEETKNWTAEQRLQYAAYWIKKAVQQARTGTILRVASEFVLTANMRTLDGITVETNE